MPELELESLSHRKTHPDEDIEIKKSDDAVEDPIHQALTDNRTRKQKNTEKIQFAALCWCLFLAGWNDGSTGPLLPRIQDVYHVHLTQPYNYAQLTYTPRSDLPSYP